MLASRIGYLSFIVVSVSVQSVAGAQAIVNSGGFEPVLYSIGDLEGQQNWLSAGDKVSTAAVQATETDRGSQAVAVQRNGRSDHRWAIPKTGFPTGRYVTISWDMAVTIQLTPGAFGPFFGIEAYDGEGAFGLLASLGVDAGTGELLYQAEDTGFLTPLGAKVTTGTWNEFRLELDFLEDRFTGFLNDQPVVSNGFVDRGLGLDQFTDADLSTFAVAGDVLSQNLSGSALFDNFIVLDGIAGDFNGDGFVDSADFTVWRDTLGTQPSQQLAAEQILADANGDGIVDLMDLDVWKTNFGRSNILPNTAHNIPEPTGGGFAFYGVVLILVAARGKWLK